ncbi:hypothetical protein GCM10027192_23410 [Psychrobacter pocilloporae]|uniref:Uncharacterized protein n=1 Tax=Psychrobacter pocilloporae TaxID=1775882 RepID=A0ABT6IVD1_9GAMM|nr:hypothetical protein [Psychrobacter pocilloporae]
MLLLLYLFRLIVINIKKKLLASYDVTGITYSEVAIIQALIYRQSLLGRLSLANSVVLLILIKIDIWA